MGGRNHIMGLLDNIPKTADLIAAHHRASLAHDDVAQPAPVAAVPAAPVPAEATPDPGPVQQMDGGMENYGGAGNRFCSATMGGSCSFQGDGPDAKCSSCQMTRAEKESPAEGACPEMMSPVNGRDDFSPPQPLGWENQHVTSYGRTNSPTEALRGSERKKANQLEELDPWASYTKGMFL